MTDSRRARWPWRRLAFALALALVMPLAGPTTAADSIRPGYARANQALAAACAVATEQGRPDACAAAMRYADTWKKAMDADIAALHLASTSATGSQLAQLELMMKTAATLGALELAGPCGTDVAAFPLAGNLLPTFGRLFVQGVSTAADAKPDLIANTMALADDLLGVAVDADQPSSLTSPLCPSASPA
jgi:hypothetical protein